MNKQNPTGTGTCNEKEMGRVIHHFSTPGFWRGLTNYKPDPNKFL
jgi:hypothetical protein